MQCKILTACHSYHRPISIKLVSNYEICYISIINIFGITLRLQHSIWLEMQDSRPTTRLLIRRLITCREGKHITCKYQNTQLDLEPRTPITDTSWLLYWDWSRPQGSWEHNVDELIAACYFCEASALFPMHFHPILGKLQDVRWGISV